MSGPGTTEFGGYLRRLREAAGLTQEDLAARSGLSAKAISALERGERKRPYPHTVAVLAEALRLSDTEREAFVDAAPKRFAGPLLPEPSPASSALLAVPPTPLLGRQADANAITSLLTAGGRLVTLTGPGGVGKTRLAAAVADNAADKFADGVCVAPLAALQDPELVVSAISQALALRDPGGRVLADTVRDYLASRHLLLVLDNFEHVTAAAPAVATLLASAPGVAVLVTSRAPLRLRGETEYPVAPLALPGDDTKHDIDTVADTPAVQLFVERARATNPDFGLTEANLAAVVEICRRLDGIPLAIELAAAQTRFLSASRLLSRLDEALELSGPRDLPQRQRTLRATLQWSYDLLDQDEQALFRRLSVAAGSFSLEAAEAIGASSDASSDVTEGLGRLIEQSLLVVVPATDRVDEIRYRLLEPVRQYAQELLDDDSDEASDARRRHATFFLDLAVTAEPALKRTEQVAWLERLEREHSNLRVAISWAIASRDVDLAARATSLWVFWWYRGHHREASGWMEAILGLSPPETATLKALIVGASMLFALGDLPASDAYCERALALAQEIGDDTLAAWARLGLGLSAMERGAIEEAAEGMRLALHDLERTGDVYGAALAASCCGMVALNRGEEAQAVELFERARRRAGSLGDRAHGYIATYNLAQMALSASDHDQAAALLREAVTLSAEIGDRANLAYCFEALATVAGALGQAERAARLAGAAQALHEIIGLPVYSYYGPYRSLHQRTLATVQATLGTDDYERAIACGRELSLDQAVEYALS